MEDLNLSMNPSNPSCLICLEALNSESSSSSSSSNLKSRQDICLQFSTSVSKFIQMNKKLDIDISQLNTLTFNHENEEPNSETLRMCCENCFESLNQFCNNYDQLQSLHKELLQNLYGLFLKQKTESQKVTQNQKRMTKTPVQSSSHLDDSFDAAASDFDGGYHDYDNGNFELDIPFKDKVTHGRRRDRPLRRHHAPGSRIYNRGSERKSVFITRMDPHFGLTSTNGGCWRQCYRCLMCPSPKFLQTERSLLEHMSGHTKEKIYHCQVCQREFHYMKSFKLHQVLYHRPNITNPSDFMKCDICEMTFDGEWLLGRHREEDHNVRNLKRKRRTEKSIEVPAPFTCDLCHTTFERGKFLNRHLMDVHKLEPKFICEEPTCGKKFWKLGQLTMHRQRMHPTDPNNPKPYVCELCQKRFSIKYDLQSHKRRYHFGKAPTKKQLCDLCGKSYFNERDLIRHHEIMHDPNRQEKAKVSYKCDAEGCGKIFNRKHDFLGHRLSHSKERNQQCDHCGEAFKRKDNLKRHILEKHPEVPFFNCKDCGENFHKYSQLQQHREKFHPSKNQRLGLGKWKARKRSSPKPKT